MRTTVDIPDEVYKAVKVLAAQRGTTVRELVLEGLETVMRTRKTGRVGLESPERPHAEFGGLEISPETNDDLIGFP
ncbi:MAG: ribbon-helix-helix domain-containing protein [Terracidiphilus sp.]